MLDEGLAARLSEPVRREYMENRTAEHRFAGQKATPMK